nr:putative lipoprotein [Kibdelosporangium sp. MJ126-NF4]
MAVSGCTNDTAQPDPDNPGVIVPGRPGESAATLAPGQAPAAASKDKPNDTDFRYARMMIKHHQQALEMTGLVPQRGANPTVKSFASRIADTQGPDIKSMEGWLAKNGGGPAHDAHEQMKGMASAEQLAALRAATGPEFDRMFLQLMTAHHEGAVEMATDVLQTGSDVFVEEMAQDVIVTQQKEIGQMKAMLTP